MWLVFLLGCGGKIVETAPFDDMTLETAWAVKCDGDGRYWIVEMLPAWVRASDDCWMEPWAMPPETPMATVLAWAVAETLAPSKARPVGASTKA